MPYTKPDGSRNYKKEYEEYHSRPVQRKNRSLRTVARRSAIADGVVKKGSDKDLDHIKPLSKGGSNSKSNLRVVPKSVNRSFSRNSDGSMKSQVSRKGK